MKTFGFQDETEVLNFVDDKENKIEFIRIIFPDILGRAMNFTIPTSEFETALREGKGFDGSSVEGFCRIEESDLFIVPDPKTFRVLPWVYENNNFSWREGVIFGDIFTPDKEHFLGDSRYLLKEVLQKTKDIGEMFVGPEMEFFIFPNKKEAKLTDEGGYLYGGLYGELRKSIQLFLKEIGIACDCDHHEAAPSQHEIDIKYSDALSMADSVMLAKYIIKRVAAKSGLFASFMPKPITKINGSGMHLHISLWTPPTHHPPASRAPNGKNLFFKNEKDPLSDLAKGYITGLIKYGKEIQPVLNQWVNSYKRLIPGYEAPTYLAWGQRNRSAYIRIPQYQKGRERSTRIELRSPDPAGNIYLGLAIIQAAGIKGIKEKLPFPPVVEEDIFEMTIEERKRRKIDTLSKNLKESLGHFQKSDLVKKTLTDHLFKKFVANKEYEWSLYRKNVKEGFEQQVSDYEIKHYLPVL